MKRFLQALLIAIALILIVPDYSFANPKPKHKKYWSHRKKDALIGGVGGAAVGAAVSHNKGKRALIGGRLVPRQVTCTAKAKTKKTNSYFRNCKNWTEIDLV